jgi:hypothetical protein
MGSSDAKYFRYGKVDAEVVGGDNCTPKSKDGPNMLLEPFSATEVE